MLVVPVRMCVPVAASQMIHFGIFWLEGCRPKFGSLRVRKCFVGGRW